MNCNGGDMDDDKDDDNDELVGDVHFDLSLP